MAKNIQALLSNAVYISGLADRAHRPVTGQQINVALNYFVEVLDVYRHDIPFQATDEITGIENLKNVGYADVTSVIYLLETVKYSLAQRNRDDFERESSITTLKTIPTIYFMDVGAQELKVYPEPTPSQGQTFFISYTGLYNINDIQLTATIDNALVPPFMQLFLEYEIAMLLANEYGDIMWTATKESMRQSLYQKLVDNQDTLPPQPDVFALKDTGLPKQFLKYWTRTGIPNGS